MNQQILDNPNDVPPWELSKDNPEAWVKIGEERRWYLLEVLPPYYFPGGFAVSEAARHTKEGHPVYTCVCTFGGQSYARELTLAQARIHARELRDQLTPS